VAEYADLESGANMRIVLSVLMAAMKGMKGANKIADAIRKPGNERNDSS
jgi:hypothetical protein